MSETNASPAITLQVPVAVSVERGTAEAHGWSVLGTIIMAASIGAAAWALAQAGWLEFAATLLTMFLVQLARLLFTAGIIAMPKSSGDTEDFAVTKSTFRTMSAEFAAWQARSSMIRLAALAAAYAVAFMIARLTLSTMLGIFSNPWIAGAAMGLVASFIVAPGLIGKQISRLKSKGVVVAPATTAATPVSSAPVQAPAPVSQPVAPQQRVVKKVYRQAGN